MRIEVEYVRLTAQQVAALQAETVKTKAWNTIHCWGNHGPVKTIVTLSTDQLEAMLITQPHIPPECRAAILELLKRRYKEKILSQLP